MDMSAPPGGNNEYRQYESSMGTQSPKKHVSVTKAKRAKIPREHRGHGALGMEKFESEGEYKTVKRFPKLANDILSFKERREVTRRRVKGGSHTWDQGSVSSCRSVRSIMSDLTRSPFEDDPDAGPLQSIRRSMLLKKRGVRKGALPDVKVRRRASVVAMEEEARSGALESANVKLRKAARNYDRYRDGEALTRSFIDYSLGSEEFRKQLRRAMGVNLTKEEAAALLRHNDRDGNGLMDGAEFLLMFFREAHEERSKAAQKVQSIRRAREEDEKTSLKKEAEREEELDRRAASKDFTDSDARRVLRRLARKAATFDVTSEDGRRTSACFGCILRPAGMKEQLVKSFGMKTTRKELGALMHHFDKDGDGEVSGAEFMVTFSKLGMMARENERRKRDKAVQLKRDRGFLLPLVEANLGR